MISYLNNLKPEHFNYENESTHVLTTIYGILCGTKNRDQHLGISKALELIKSSTLIIDDIIDQSPKRNGINSLYKDIGIGPSVLIAEILKSHAISEISEIVAKLDSSKLKEIIRLLEETYSTICQGQLLDIEFESKPIKEIEISDYLKMIEMTSAHFISLPGALASILNGWSKIKKNKISEFGLYLGLAYQIRDDILDIVGDQEYLGKVEYRDLRTKKKRLPLIITYKLTSPNGRNEINKLMNSKRELNNKQINQLTKYISSTGAIKKCIDLIGEFKVKALSNIKVTTSYSIYNKLEALTNLVTGFQTLNNQTKIKFGITD